MFTNTNKTCPCKGCEEPVRHVGCHSTCQAFIDWETDHRAKQEEDKKRLNIESDYHSYKTDRFRKTCRRLSRG